MFCPTVCGWFPSRGAAPAPRPPEALAVWQKPECIGRIPAPPDSVTLHSVKARVVFASQISTLKVLTAFSRLPVSGYHTHPHLI